MAAYDEITDRNVAHINQTRQSELIQEYCADLEQRVAKAANPEEAHTLAFKTCTSFRLSCESAIVLKFLNNYAESVLKRHSWITR